MKEQGKLGKQAETPILSPQTYTGLLAVLFCIYLPSFLKAYKKLGTHIHVVILFTEFDNLFFPAK